MTQEASASFASQSEPGQLISICLSAVVVAATTDEPRVLALRAKSRDAAEALPSGQLAPEHRTLESGLRAWVERQTKQQLGYVEQLYTFGDRDRSGSDHATAERALAVAYLALVREARPAGLAEASWRNWYVFLPWEDWRNGRTAVLDVVERRLRAWAKTGPTDAVRRLRRERIEATFGFGELGWNDERVLERYELLFEAKLLPEAWRDCGEAVPGKRSLIPGVPMALDHRRMLATAIGRLRGKIKYRPVVFELMPPAFTLLELQRTVEALAGVRLHKQNFRRLVEAQGLIEETGETRTETGGRPARLVQFRREVLLERPAPGLRLPRRATPA
ncbi:MAG: NUDIX hydrolase [Rhodoplanes sp.]